MKKILLTTFLLVFGAHSYAAEPPIVKVNCDDVKISTLTIGKNDFRFYAYWNEPTRFPNPPISRKIGKTAMSEMTLAAQEWKSADWAFAKGLYANTFDSIEALDIAITDFSSKLSSYNPEALIEMKKVLWEGTQHWEALLLERAAISGKLVLSDFTKKALLQFKK